MAPGRGGVRPAIALLAGGLALALSACGDAPIDPTTIDLGAGPTVRVQLLDDAVTELEFASEGRVELRRLPDKSLLLELDSPLVVRRVGGRLEVNSRPVDAAAFRLDPVDAGYFAVREIAPTRADESRRYRGTLDFIAHDPAPTEHRVRIINELSVEEYLVGVVGREMEDRRFSLQALKAQAVVARTYTLYHLRKGGPLQLHESFPGSALFQAYGGMDVRSEAFEAVKQTRGRVLTYDGKLFQTFYHSTCGGHTETGRVFHERPIPPLEGVMCPYCKNAPLATWELELPIRDVDEALRGWVRENGLDAARITGIRPIRDEPGERSLYIEVQHAGGSFEIRSDHFRQRMLDAGYRFYSGDFDVTPRASARGDVVLQFKGRGFGHGVGLCQFGANALARKDEIVEVGESGYQAILSHYFPRSGMMTLVY